MFASTNSQVSTLQLLLRIIRSHLVYTGGSKFDIEKRRGIQRSRSRTT